jgi:putative intracellular protease/amidase
LAAVRAADEHGGACTAVLEIMSVLSAGGVGRDLVYDAGYAGVLGSGELGAGVTADLADGALGELAERSLLTFSLGGQAIIAHRLVMRVVRDQAAKQGCLTVVCQAAASVLAGRAETLARSQDRLAVRDIPEQVTALQEAVARLSGEPGDELAASLLNLRFLALYHLSELGDSAPQAIFDR